MRKKRGVFKHVLQDIAKRYGDINKKLLLSFKRNFITVNNTHDEILKIVNKEAKKGQRDVIDHSKTLSSFSGGSRRGPHSSANRRYSSLQAGHTQDYHKNLKNHDFTNNF